jgi:putative ABC transport system permease protein
METLFEQSIGPRRFNLYLLSAFASVALALAAIGLFGVMAYLVSQRTREIGVRLALGATRGEVFRQILGRGMLLAATGATIGVVAATGLSRAMETLLFSISGRDPITFVAVPIALVMVAALACYLPARRATRVDPVVALRVD